MSKSSIRRQLLATRLVTNSEESGSKPVLATLQELPVNTVAKPMTEYIIKVQGTYT